MTQQDRSVVCLSPGEVFKMFEWFFGLICGVTVGFTLAGIMAAGKAADEETEQFEHWRGER